jgi:1-acyl-sn-glycerol-3-phosphate acyltransferase
MARRGALAAGAERASGERARRRSTPLIGAEPVTVADDAATGDAAPGAATPTARTTKTAKAATAKRTARTASAKAATAKSASAKTASAKTATGAAPSTTGRAKGSVATQSPKGGRSAARKAAAPAPSAKPPARTSGPAGAEEPRAGAPTRRPHRPAPKVTSKPSRKVATVSGERPRRPRTSPREKALRDAAAPRPHLRLAEPPLDPTVADAPSRSGLPLPDVAEMVEALVTGLRVAAGAAGVAPEEVEQRVAQVLAYLRRRVEGDYAVDDFGYDEDFTTNVFYPLLRPLYRHWFRVEVRGIENIPDTGGALLVSNHSGTVAYDSLMIQLAVHDEHPRQRVMRALGADFLFQTPFLGTIARRSGSTLATGSDAERLLSAGELVGVFPEGFKGIGKPFSERYKLQRFGRGGFVSSALRAGVPIIPCSVVGAEEIAPIIGNMNTLARLLGVPYMPVTPTWPLLGPLGMVPLPSKWIIEFGRPIATDAHEPGAADDPMLVFDLTDQVRETIQQTLYTLLMQRRSVFF